MSGHRLLVSVRAADPERAAELRGWVEAAGHGVSADAGLVLADCFARTPPPEDAAQLVVLSDDPAVADDASIEGVLPRAADVTQIDAALRAVAAGLSVRGPGAARAFGPMAAAEFPLAGFPTPGPALTPRELQILEALGEGMSNKEVARALGISAHTVKFHLEAVFGKLHARSRADAVAKGLRHGLIEV